jgi:hypothetical protein
MRGAQAMGEIRPRSILVVDNNNGCESGRIRLKSICVLTVFFGRWRGLEGLVKVLMVGGRLVFSVEAR